jgi:polyisoprenoid-binding protein YceI
MAIVRRMTELITGTWKIDPVHSAATFSVKYLAGRFHRDFDSVSAQLADGKLTGSVDVKSVNITHETFREHVVTGAAFFDVENYPAISFSSTKLDVDGDAVTLDGELTIKGITKPISATGKLTGPIDDPQGHKRIGVSFATTIDRTEFNLGLDFPSQLMGHEVELEVDLFLVAAA